MFTCFKTIGKRGEKKEYWQKWEVFSYKQYKKGLLNQKTLSQRLFMKKVTSGTLCKRNNSPDSTFTSFLFGSRSVQVHSAKPKQKRCMSTFYFTQKLKSKSKLLKKNSHKSHQQIISTSYALSTTKEKIRLRAVRSRQGGNKEKRTDFIILCCGGSQH